MAKITTGHDTKGPKPAKPKSVSWHYEEIVCGPNDNAYEIKEVRANNGWEFVDQRVESTTRSIGLGLSRRVKTTHITVLTFRITDAKFKKMFSTSNKSKRVKQAAKKPAKATKEKLPVEWAGVCCLMLVGLVVAAASGSGITTSAASPSKVEVARVEFVENAKTEALAKCNMTSETSDWHNVSFAVPTPCHVEYLEKKMIAYDGLSHTPRANVNHWLENGRATRLSWRTGKWSCTVKKNRVWTHRLCAETNSWANDKGPT